MATTGVKESDLNKSTICATSHCTACSACINGCPQNCISMKTDEYGELYPYIDKDKCIHCGVCQKYCPNYNNVSLYQPIGCYAGWRKDKSKRMNSSSGGIAAFLAEQFISKGNIVYGVIYEHSKGVHYKRASSLEEIELFKGSKYVQAEVGYTFQDILKDLQNGNEVLFFGTPCQIAGLLSYFSSNQLRKELSKRLYTIDFLCHGSIPNKYLLEELADIERIGGFRCDEVSFRSNDSNKNYYLRLAQGGHNKYSVKAENQRYFYGFLNSIFICESCVHCRYKQLLRVGDMTLGDFIGIARKEPIDASWEEMMNPSVIFINTEKGSWMLKQFCICQKDLVLFKRSILEAVEGGPSLRGGTKPSNLRNKFRSLYPEYGFVVAANKTVSTYIKINSMKRSVTALVHKSKGLIKQMIKRVTCI